MSFLTPEDINISIRLVTATLLGGLIGMEREWHGKEAGFRTHALVSLGSALVMVVSIQIYEIYHGVTNMDPGRIAAQVVSGIGFIGAGAIIRSQEKVTGLTTAAVLWSSAGVGLACGLGQYKPAFISTFLILVVLILFSKVDQYFSKKHKSRVHPSNPAS